MSLNKVLNELIQARLELSERVASKGSDIVAPNIQFQCWLPSVILEEFKCIFLQLVHVYRQNDSAGRYLRWFEVQKLWLDQLLFANGVGYFKYRWDFIRIQDSEVSLNELNWPWEVEIEAQLHEDLCLNIRESLLAHILLFFVGQQVDHSCEAWRNWLLKFC